MIIRYVGIEALNIKCDKYEVVMVSLNLLRKLCGGNLLCLVHMMVYYYLYLNLKNL